MANTDQALTLQPEEASAFQQYAKPSLERHERALRSLAARYAREFEGRTERIGARTVADAIVEFSDLLTGSMALFLELERAGFPVASKRDYNALMASLAKVLLRDAFLETAGAH